MNERICASFSMSQLFFIAVNYLHDYYCGTGARAGAGAGVRPWIRAVGVAARERLRQICN